MTKSGGRLSLTALVLIAVGVLSVLSFYWLALDPREDQDFQVIAEWSIAAGGQGLIIAVSPRFTVGELRALGARFHERFQTADNAVVMIFDDADAARQIRRGSRDIDEKRFQAALIRQRAMYFKVSGGREGSFTIYNPYPTVTEVIRFGR